MVRLWNVDSGEHLRDLAGHEDRVLQPPSRSTANGSSPPAKIRRREFGTLKTASNCTCSGDITGPCSGPSSLARRSLRSDGERRRHGRHLGRRNREVTSHAFGTHGGGELGVFFRRRSSHRYGFARTNAKVWDAATGKELLTLRGHADEVTVAKFSSSGRAVLTAGADGRAVFWPAVEWKLPDSMETSGARTSGSVR